jgi:hypothetical protein
VRAWLTPWSVLARCWRSWSPAPPPWQLQRLLDGLAAGRPLHLYLVLPAVNRAGEDGLGAGRDVDPAHVLAADLTERDPRQRERGTAEVGVQQLGQEQLVAVPVGQEKL